MKKEELKDLSNIICNKIVADLTDKEIFNEVLEGDLENSHMGILINYENEHLSGYSCVDSIIREHIGCSKVKISAKQGKIVIERIGE